MSEVVLPAGTVRATSSPGLPGSIWPRTQTTPTPTMSTTTTSSPSRARPQRRPPPRPADAGMATYSLSS